MLCIYPTTHKRYHSDEIPIIEYVKKIKMICWWRCRCRQWWWWWRWRWCYGYWMICHRLMGMWTWVCGRMGGHNDDMILITNKNKKQQKKNITIHDWWITSRQEHKICDMIINLMLKIQELQQTASLKIEEEWLNSFRDNCRWDLIWRVWDVVWGKVMYLSSPKDLQQKQYNHGEL